LASLLPRSELGHRRLAQLGILGLVAEPCLAALELTVVRTPPITRRTLDIGVRGTPEGLCIPCKLLFGNYVEAAECGATDIIMLGGAGSCRLRYSAAQQAQRLRSVGFSVRVYTWDLYRQMPDLLRATIADLPPLIAPDIDLSQGMRALWTLVLELGTALTFNPLALREAALAAWAARLKARAAMLEGTLTPPGV
jgi:hypothetical protein